MSTLIAYSTKHGCTEKCVNMLLDKLSDLTETVNLKNKREIDLSKYDKVIIGGSIYAGQIQKEVKKFCHDNLETLRKKRVALFLCCMFEGDAAKKQMEDAFPKELLIMAEAKGFFGGELIPEKMGFLERSIVRAVAKTSESTSNISEENIDKFVQTVNV